MRTLNDIPVVAALRVLADLCCDDQIVVTNQGSSRIWPKLRRRSLDFHYNPSTMSGAIPLALGLALAQPQREVLAISGDGSLLMSLGSLVTVVGSGVTNLTVVLLDNGIYEVTGGQETPAARVDQDPAKRRCPRHHARAGAALAAGGPTAPMLELASAAAANASVVEASAILAQVLCLWSMLVPPPIRWRWLFFDYGSRHASCFRPRRRERGLVVAVGAMLCVVRWVGLGSVLRR